MGRPRRMTARATGLSQICRLPRRRAEMRPLRKATCWRSSCVSSSS